MPIQSIQDITALTPRERWIWVKSELERRGSSLAEIARKLGVNPRLMSQTKVSSCERVERALAEEIGVPQHVLFPDRYAPDGRRLVQTRVRRTPAAKKVA